MPDIERYGHYDSGYEDLNEERVRAAWNSNTTFSERAFAEATNLGCLNFMNTSTCGGRAKNRDIDTMKCVPMRPPLNPHPDLDHYEVGRIFNPKYQDPRYLRPDIPIPDDYAPDPNGYPCDGANPDCTGVACDLGDLRDSYKKQKPSCRSKSKKSSQPAPQPAAQAEVMSGTVCDLKNLNIQHVAGCTMNTLEDVLSDFQHWGDVPGDSFWQKLQYVFGSNDRPFYLGLTLVFILLLVLVIKVVWSMFEKPQPQPQPMFISV